MTSVGTKSWTAAEIAAVGEGLLAGTWPVAEWRHAHHVLATAWLLRERPDLDLEAALPGIIRRYNVAQGGQNTDTAGYHHTITVLYLAAIRAALAAMPAGISLESAAARLLASPLGDKAYPLRFYSRERLFSTEARRGWVGPDLAPLETGP